MNDEKLQHTLKQLGFSEKEITVYLVSLKHGCIKVSDLAEEADVSVRYVYNVTKELEQRGLIVIEDHITPTTIRPISPKESISHLMDELSTVESELNTRFEKNQYEPDIEVLKSRSTLLNRIQEKIRNAKSEIHLSVPVEALPDIVDDLKDAINRDVFILLLVTHAATDTAALDYDSIASVVRATKEDFPPLMTVDNIDGLFSPPEMFRGVHSHSQCIRIQQRQLIPILVSAFLGNYWRAGREIHKVHSSEIPRKYTAFRHAVYDATCHLNNGREFYAELKVRPLSNGSGVETITGPVVNTEQSLIEPLSSSLYIVNSVHVEVDGEIVTVGGRGSFIEDFEAKVVRLTL
jgi:sugar-specific transcriptional regulator TrmB